MIHGIWAVETPLLVGEKNSGKEANDMHMISIPCH